MRLRNKKTGEVFESFKRGPIDLYFYPNEHKGGDEIERETYQSLAELNADWEDYTPAKPLIKDGKVRKAIRAWAEANAIITVEYDEYWVSFRRDDKTISFKDEDRCLGIYELDDHGLYTIDELCGEEEEE